MCSLAAFIVRLSVIRLAYAFQALELSPPIGRQDFRRVVLHEGQVHQEGANPPAVFGRSDLPRSAWLIRPPATRSGWMPRGQLQCQERLAMLPVRARGDADWRLEFAEHAGGRDWRLRRHGELSRNTMNIPQVGLAMQGGYALNGWCVSQDTESDAAQHFDGKESGIPSPVLTPWFSDAISSAPMCWRRIICRRMFARGTIWAAPDCGGSALPGTAFPALPEAMFPPTAAFAIRAGLSFRWLTVMRNLRSSAICWPIIRMSPGPIDRRHDREEQPETDRCRLNRASPSCHIFMRQDSFARL